MAEDLLKLASAPALRQVLAMGYTKAEIRQALRALERTPSGRSSGPRGKQRFRRAPRSVREEALLGLEIRAEAPRSRRGGTAIGLGRAFQLALGLPVWDRSIRRMKSYFARHQNDFRPGWDRPGEETRGYIAWLLWGGDEGWDWVKAL